ncbi:helix-turn-helix transcriptional regulator [Chitinophaga pendula]|uniref:helix-turn-helix domain-containing protein n=1 Tax=Chitinophaga TaxID=79328 RepID=UPI000BAF7C86|nr:MULTISPECIES: helix-turn-helix transcriptional regulator [Chitinophaga]ASZ12128.1 AraC family transcriptional regulator [Chitinophaga sp. MD30]UCJ04833.1 helix-turn-helix transcriptional regulator [Chitinophaga pendula]
MKHQTPRRINSISDFHKFRNLPMPEHPLISVVDYALIKPGTEDESQGFIFDFYSISLKRTTNAKLIYGQQEYDFDSGVLFFLAPNQAFNVKHSRKTTPAHTGWLLLIHPDFLWNTSLSAGIKKYEFFDYAVNEALFLSEREEILINNIIENIEQEYRSHIDKFSQNIIIAQIETLLNYSERFYQRQFVTRKITNHQVLQRLEEILDTHFADTDNGLPTVRHIARELNVSPGYLGALLKSLTGMNTQQHIHEKLIARAKEELCTTHLSVSEIAYKLGFEHLQSFSKLFKNKTGVTPQEFRQSFKNN